MSRQRIDIFISGVMAMDFAAKSINRKTTHWGFCALLVVILLTGAQSARAEQCPCPSTVVEGLLGNVDGNAIGRTIAVSDLRSAEKGFYKASRVALGETVYWHNECTGNWGAFVAVCDDNSQCGNYCRKFATEVCINGRATRGFATACRRANGNWYLLFPV